jgi:hypothetical protein
MNRVELSKEQVRKLLRSWKNAASDSIEKRLIEDLFLITETISPIGFENFEIKPPARSRS